MPSFKLWFVSAVLFAIVFPRSTVVAEEVPADEGIVGTWTLTHAPDPKKETATGIAESLNKRFGRASVEIRADGTYAEQHFIDGEKHDYVGTWRLVDRGEGKLVLEIGPKGEEKSGNSFAWISKDEFTIEVPSLKAETLGLVTGVRFQRIKVAPKP